MGFIPSENNYVMISNNHNLSLDELSRSIVYHPQTESVNLGLSIKMIIAHADAIGLTAITVFLKKYKPNLFYSVSPPKNNLKLMIKYISHECGMTQEIYKIKHELSNFCRSPSHTFRDLTPCIFISWITFKQLTPFLISPKCARHYSEWVEKTSQMSLQQL